MAKHKFGYKPIETFIEFRLQTRPDNKRTDMWEVVNTMRGDEVYCGYIAWHGPWRKYVFHAPEAAFYDVDFLRYVADFIDRQMRERRVNHGA